MIPHDRLHNNKYGMFISFLFQFTYLCKSEKNFLSSSMSYESERMKINEEKIFSSLNSSHTYFPVRGGKRKMKVGYDKEE